MTSLRSVPTRLNLTLPADLDAALTEWRRSQSDVPDRQEAIRRILERALSGRYDIRDA